MKDPLEPHNPGDRFGLRDRRGRLVLDRDAATELNGIVAELKRLGKVSVEAPLVYRDDASGRNWGISRPTRLFVKLSGTTSPYTWAEAQYDPAGTSSLVSGGRTGTAYEANALGGLGGQYVTIDWTPAGDWRFQIARSGPPRIPLSGCCVAQGGLPPVINLTVNSGSGAGYTPATLTHGPKPSGVTFVSGTACDPGWWSPLTPTPTSIYGLYYNICSCGEVQVFGSSLGTNYGLIGGTAYTNFPLEGRSCSPFLWVGVIQSMGTAGTDFGTASFTISG